MPNQNEQTPSLGRPPLADSERKDERVVFRVEGWRKAAWTKAAQKKQGRTLEKFARETLDAASEKEGVKPRPPRV